jgi:hypothetical protein
VQRHCQSWGLRTIVGLFERRFMGNAGVLAVLSLLSLVLLFSACGRDVFAPTLDPPPSRLAADEMNCRTMSYAGTQELTGVTAPAGHTLTWFTDGSLAHYVLCSPDIAQAFAVYDPTAPCVSGNWYEPHCFEDLVLQSVVTGGGSGGGGGGGGYGGSGGSGDGSSCDPRIAGCVVALRDIDRDWLSHWESLLKPDSLIAEEHRAMCFELRLDTRSAFAVDAVFRGALGIPDDSSDVDADHPGAWDGSRIHIDQELLDQALTSAVARSHVVVVLLHEAAHSAGKNHAHPRDEPWPQNPPFVFLTYDSSNPCVKY